MRASSPEPGSHSIKLTPINLMRRLRIYRATFTYYICPNSVALGPFPYRISTVVFVFTRHNGCIQIGYCNLMVLFPQDTMTASKWDPLM